MPARSHSRSGSESGASGSESEAEVESRYLSTSAAAAAAPPYYETATNSVDQRVDGRLEAALSALRATTPGSGSSASASVSTGIDPNFPRGPFRMHPAPAYRDLSSWDNAIATGSNASIGGSPQGLLPSPATNPRRRRTPTRASGSGTAARNRSRSPSPARDDDDDDEATPTAVNKRLLGGAAAAQGGSSSSWGSPSPAGRQAGLGYGRPPNSSNLPAGGAADQDAAARDGDAQQQQQRAPSGLVAGFRSVSAALAALRAPRGAARGAAASGAGPGFRRYDDVRHHAGDLESSDEKGMLTEDEDDDEYADDGGDLGEKALMAHELNLGLGDPLTARHHFGPAPQGRVVRRHRTKKRVALTTSGHLVLDLPIPTKLETFLPPALEASREETRSTRYTAVTCDPNEYLEAQFSLRQVDAGRETELLVVITMYNEDEVLFLRTLYGVMRNISHLEGRKNSRTWGKGAWQKVVVCIVADGRKHISPSVLDCLAALGVYQEGAMKNRVEGQDVQAHVFEYTTSFALTPDMRFKFGDKGVVPTQIIFCLKEKNARKINSHRWFFQAFARTLEPKVCILLDVGTMPHVKALYHLWKAFDTNSKVGGACGELAVYKGKHWRSMLNPLVAAQDFEYRIANILDKATESVFGYCAVLPGAFSAYRWKALQNNKDGTGPLASYYKGEILHGSNADTFTANMYLAEDRILCWEIVAKPGQNYVLKYVKAAVAETDCPDTIPEFISQRRRWLNGSFFAAVYALTHVMGILRTSHGPLRKMLLFVQAFYNLVMLIFQFFSLANFFIFFVILTSGLEAASFNIPHINVLNGIVQYAYVGLVIACFLFSMGNRPQGSPWKYKLAITSFAVLTVYMLVCAVLCAVKAFQGISGNAIFVRMIVSVLATYGVYILASVLSLKPLHLLTSFAQYVLFQATYINVLNVYAFSNLHDLSWGTKGADKVDDDLGSVDGAKNGIVEVELLADQKDVDAAYSDALDHLRVRQPQAAPAVRTRAQDEQQQKDYYANFRTNVLLAWALSNGLLASIILAGGGSSDTFNGEKSRTSVYMLAILGESPEQSCRGVTTLI